MCFPRAAVLRRPDASGFPDLKGNLTASIAAPVCSTYSSPCRWRSSKRVAEEEPIVNVSHQPDVSHQQRHASDMKNVVLFTLTLPVLDIQ